MAEGIERIELLHASFPLKRPYRLSFGEIRSFETLFTVIYSGESVGLGECTPLFGYNWENIKTAKEALTTVAPRLIGLPSEGARSVALGLQESAPFAASSILSALDVIEKGLETTKNISAINLIKSIDISNKRQALSLLTKGIREGYKCFKVKIGSNMEAESKVFNSVLSSAPHEALFRCDGNKNVGFSEAMNFAENLTSPEKIEYIEQPFPEDSWDDHRRFQESTGIAVTLDESIYTTDDVKMASQSGACRGIKLKLMKHGGIRETLAVGEEARKQGLKVVLGNGVQTDWGCYLEAILHTRLSLETYGEMVGFIKQKTSFLVDSLELGGAALFMSYPPSDVKMVIERIKRIHRECLCFS
jgi:o-succinylbenzoate synthase